MAVNQPPATSVEPGYKTTEFWAMVFAQVGTFWPALNGHLSWTEASAIGAGVAALYGFIRSWRKK